MNSDARDMSCVGWAYRDWDRDRSLECKPITFKLIVLDQRIPDLHYKYLG